MTFRELIKEWRASAARDGKQHYSLGRAIRSSSCADELERLCDEMDAKLERQDIMGYVARFDATHIRTHILGVKES